MPLTNALQRSQLCCASGGSWLRPANERLASSWYRDWFRHSDAAVRASESQRLSWETLSHSYSSWTWTQTEVRLRWTSCHREVRICWECGSCSAKGTNERWREKLGPGDNGWAPGSGCMWNHISLDFPESMQVNTFPLQAQTTLPQIRCHLQQERVLTDQLHTGGGPEDNTALGSVILKVTGNDSTMLPSRVKGIL